MSIVKKKQKSKLLLLSAICLMLLSLFALASFKTVHASSVTRVQGNCRGVSDSTTLTVTMTSTPTNGNLLVMAVGINDGTVSSVSETGVTWTRQVYTGITTYGYDAEIWAGVIGSSASQTITITLTGTYLKASAADVCEYSGLLSSGFLDQNATASGASSNSSTGTTGPTSQANELLAGAIVATVSQSSPKNGFTMLDGSQNEPYGNDVLAYLENAASTTGTYNSGTTVGGTGYWAGCIATFKAAASTSSGLYVIHPEPTTKESITAPLGIIAVAAIIIVIIILCGVILAVNYYKNKTKRTQQDSGGKALKQ
jgi:hypothetical protein